MTSLVEQLLDSGIVGILRHLRPQSALEVGATLRDAGLTTVEVPLNNESEALESIRLLANTFGHEMLIGAGTVTDATQVPRVRDAGGCFIVSPDTNPDVISASVHAGLVSCPGFMTPSEAFTALREGADMLKLFPASLHQPRGLAALMDVLPTETGILAVGGVAESNVEAWGQAGAAGVGVGSALFRPEYSADEVRRRATAFMAAWGTTSGDQPAGGAAP